MTVLEYNPRPALECFIDHLDGKGTLTLTLKRFFTKVSPIPSPCPYLPTKLTRERDWSLYPPNPISSANLSNTAVGSAPGVKTKMSGMKHWDSMKDLERSNGGGSMYFFPRLPLTNSWTPGTNLSDRMTRRIRSFWKCFSLVFHGAGSCS